MDVPRVQFFKWDSLALENLYVIRVDAVGVFGEAKDRDTALRQFQKPFGVVLFWDLNVDHAMLCN